MRSKKRCCRRRAPTTAANQPRNLHELPPDLMTNIHGRLSFVDRLAFAAVSGASRHMLKPEAPWLILPGETPGTATLFSLTDQRVATVRSPDSALQDHVILGSSGGWLVTADERARMNLVNPVTGEQAALPAITTRSTIPFLNVSSKGFDLQMEPFLQIRFGGSPPYDDLWRPIPPRGYTLTIGRMREWFYRKVVLSASPRTGSYAAMLLLERSLGAPAFTTAEDPVWRLGPSRHGVEDAIHHKGRFYSITYSGVVEAWEHDADAGKFTSKVVTSMLASEEDDHEHRKYLATAPDGRLMVVFKGCKEIEERYCRPRFKCFFKVQVLDDEASGRWKEAANIGDVALFVGVNNSLCVSTRQHPELKAGCVYFTDDELGQASLRKDYRDRCFPDGYIYDRWDVGVYSLEDGTVEEIEALGEHVQEMAAAGVVHTFHPMIEVS